MFYKFERRIIVKKDIVLCFYLLESVLIMMEEWYEFLDKKFFEGVYIFNDFDVI